MRFQSGLLACLTAVTLVACGGGGDEAPFTQALGLSLEAAPYINAMPTATIDGSSPDCTGLIVPFTVRGAKGVVPAALHAGNMVLVDPTTGKIVWTAETLASALEKRVTKDDLPGTYSQESRSPDTFKETVLQGVARGCWTAEVIPDETLMVMVDLDMGWEKASLSATAKTSVVN